jgi:hypothetical protein
MPGIPAITGEQVEVAANDECVRRMFESAGDRRANRIYRPMTGRKPSPMRLRLDDFSGEGERAPPERR